MHAHIDLRMSSRSHRVTAETLLAVVGEHLARHCGWDEFLKFKINLALDELITNIFSYGENKCRNAPEVSISIIVSDGGRVNISVSDDSYRFDPIQHDSAKPATDAGKTSGIVPMGGHGIRLVKDIAEHIVYFYENGKNWFILSIPDEEQVRCSY